PLPEGTDGVLMAEYAEEADGIMTASEAVPPGKHTGRIGEDIRAGDTVLHPGRRLRPQDLGVLASIAQGSVTVHRRPQVTLIVTGNELVKPGERPAGAQIVDSNSVMLRALIARDGGVTAETLHLEDDREAIRSALRQAAGDLIAMTGGTSVGVEDHAPSLIAEEGELLAHGVAMRPSSPTGLGAIGGKPVFLLPGNPVSCLAAYDFFVGLAVRRLAGLAEGWPYAKIRAVLDDRIASQIGRVDYARVTLAGRRAQLVATSGASVLSSTTRADGFVVVPQDSEGMPDGAEVDVWLYDPLSGEPT
ncbi:MAG: molybdopterin molybdotransferase MoeA, partial [SAR324 cluster bacterium]|nr:molybdopterin molybdotransferase MoeA [SAR324 cluster bacterium]